MDHGFEEFLGMCSVTYAEFQNMPVLSRVQMVEAFSRVDTLKQQEATPSTQEATPSTQQEATPSTQQEATPSTKQETTPSPQHALHCDDQKQPNGGPPAGTGELYIALKESEHVNQITSKFSSPPRHTRKRIDFDRLPLTGSVLQTLPTETRRWLERLAGVLDPAPDTKVDQETIITKLLCRESLIHFEKSLRKRTDGLKPSTYVKAYVMFQSCLSTLCGKRLSLVDGSTREIALRARDTLSDLMQRWANAAVESTNKREAQHIETHRLTAAPFETMTNVFYLFELEHLWFNHTFAGKTHSLSQASRGTGFVLLSLLLLRPVTRPGILTGLSLAQTSESLTASDATTQELVLYVTRHKTQHSFGAAVLLYVDPVIRSVLMLYLEKIRPVLKSTGLWKGESTLLFPSNAWLFVKQIFLSWRLELTPGGVRQVFCHYLSQLSDDHVAYPVSLSLQSTAGHATACGGSVVLKHYSPNAKLDLERKLWNLVVFPDFVEPARKLILEHQRVQTNKSTLLLEPFPIQAEMDMNEEIVDPSFLLSDGNESPIELITPVLQKAKKKRKRSSCEKDMNEVQVTMSLSACDVLPALLKTALKDSLVNLFLENFLSNGSAITQLVHKVFRAQWISIFGNEYIGTLKSEERLATLGKQYCQRSLKNWTHRLPILSFVNDIISACESKDGVRSLCSVAQVKCIVSPDAVLNKCRSHIAFQNVTTIPNDFLSLFRKVCEQRAWCYIAQDDLGESRGPKPDTYGHYNGLMYYLRTGNFPLLPYDVPSVADGTDEIKTIEQAYAVRPVIRRLKKHCSSPSADTH